MTHSFDVYALLTFGKGEVTSNVSPSTKIVTVDDHMELSLTKKIRFYLVILLPFILKHGKDLLLKNGISETKEILSQFLNYYNLAHIINKEVGSKQRVYLYSYWFDHWNVAAVVYKQLFNSSAIVVSRLHRYEMDANTHRWKTFPFVSLQLKYSDLLCFISSNWQDKIKKRYPKYAKKMALSRMGVASGNMSQMPTEKVKVLSLSGNIPVKQMELQAKMLTGLNLSIEWHHFGGNRSDNSLGEMVNGSKVDYLNHGFVFLKSFLLSIQQKFPFVLRLY